MPILFIAVQCCQCSTMQVKQQKKSGNKWTCVVCNQKQSIRKVYSQGYMAKDLRKFVQSFNMSRKFTDQESPHSHDPQTLIPVPASDVDDPGFGGVEKKRRTDWSEYLDVEEENPPNYYPKQEEDGDEFDGKRIATEWPEEVLKKKPRLRYHAAESSATVPGGESSDGNLYKPAFAKRTIKKAVTLSPGKELKQKTIRNSMLSTAPSTKWNDYMSHYEDDLIGGNGNHFADQADGCTMDSWENMMNDEKVEDDIHPDFR